MLISLALERVTVLDISLYASSWCLNALMPVCLYAHKSVQGWAGDEEIAKPTPPLPP